MSPVVLSGIGITSALGEGTEAHWARLVAGDSAIAALGSDPVDPLPVPAGARLGAFSVLPYLSDRKMARLLSAASGLGFAAAVEAMKSSGLDVATIAPARRGLFCQTGMFQVEGRDLAPIVEHCCEEGALSLAKFGEKGLAVINPFLPIKTLPNMGLGALSIHLDFQGPNLVAGPFAAQGAMLLSLAIAALEDGETDVCMVVGGDAPFNMMTIASLLALGVLDTRELPHLGLFDSANSGLILGEGGVALLLEREADVVARGGTVYARLGQPAMAGAAQARHGYLTDALPVAEVLLAARGDAPVDAVFADACGVPAVDRLEQDALAAAVGALPVAGAKGQVGAWLGASFLLEVAHGALTLATGQWPGPVAPGQATPQPRRLLVHGLDLAGSTCAVRLDGVEGA